ncbi:DNA fragmentation factor subunit beta isoform X4 [Malaclemys terrapin pileata]|uniref:DNA fragmentation factor subunit beta isoform X4 n=1 Tax=Malaclemys terrapin pileata TaxID=2991368 RepID=UPI0023A79E8F|nr:DNA fragmentation factor subunit beta isoform X4 [Malaclemys terrapin pileata]
MAPRPKAFKIRSLRGPQKYGVAGRSLPELLRKGGKLLQLSVPDCRLCLYEDGTELTEGYFHGIPDNTDLVLLAPGETWQGCKWEKFINYISLPSTSLIFSSFKTTVVSDIDHFLNTFYTQKDDIVEAAQKLLSDEQAPKRQKLLVDLIQNLSENILAESREEDRKWFEGIESRFKNKSSYMRYSCESRIRSYMKEVSSYTSAVHPAAQAEYKRITDFMLDKLKSVKYNGCYFDRREEEAVRLCTTEGWFSCQGPFDRDYCLCKHSINPYSNRESRILFSTWNLDHIIEKKRTIVPTLAEAVKEQDGREVAWEYFYQLLFTLENLKLVHIACHKKTSHNLTCDKTKIYRKRKCMRKVSK